VPIRHPPLPDIWLVSDAGNDAVLECVLKRLPRGSGLIFRHYHLDHDARRARFDALKHICALRSHSIVLSGSPELAARWGADGAYGSPERLAHGPAMIRLLTAHSLRELGRAKRARADAILLSPVFPTRSHPGARTLGSVRFRLLAARAKVPVVALGGMNAARARVIRTKKWAAIQGLAKGPTGMFSLHS